MNSVLMLITLIVMAISMGLYARFYQKNYVLKRQIFSLSRVEDSTQSEDALQEYLGYPKERLAKNPKIQKMLLNAPGTEWLARLLEVSGLSFSVALLLSQIILAFLSVGISVWFLGVVLPLAFLVAFLGGSLPLLYVIISRELRLSKCQKQLSPAIDSMMLYLRSGRSFPQAFTSCTAEIAEPLATEFSRCAEYYRLGRPLSLTLNQLADSMPNAVGFRMLAIAVALVGQTGGNIVEVLDRIRVTLEAQARYQMRMRSVTGESRMSAIILCAVPGIFMLVTSFTNPKYLNIFFEVPVGQKAFILFFVFWGAGGFWVYKLVNSSMG